MTFVQAIQSGFKNYVNFQGRAIRSEFWWFILFYLIIICVPEYLAYHELSSGHPGAFSGVVDLIALAFLLPNLGLAVRRLHDTGRSGWWVLIGLIPIVGWILVIIWYCTPGTVGPNKYGV